ncbi:hypothetical protein, partial [Salmonella enterica]|uniref:hypothetical protein n=1 Tax=Salmonella enterica TaxID=28901 RepID=UPI001BAE5E87
HTSNTVIISSPVAGDVVLLWVTNISATLPLGVTGLTTESALTHPVIDSAIMTDNNNWPPALYFTPELSMNHASEKIIEVI